MKLLNQNAYYFFWITAIVLIALSIYWLNFEDAVLDINVHDTYFVIHNSHILQLLAIIYSFLGFIYWFFKKIDIKLMRVLTRLHTAITILVIPIYFIGHPLFISFSESNFPLFDDTAKIQIFITVLVLITLVAQLLLILNVIISLFKHFLERT
jgi:heme/copper-type cytochrome/quinol oxidase subunit 1